MRQMLSMRRILLFLPCFLSNENSIHALAGRSVTIAISDCPSGALSDFASRSDSSDLLGLSTSFGASFYGLGSASRQMRRLVSFKDQEPDQPQQQGEHGSTLLVRLPTGRQLQLPPRRGPADDRPAAVSAEDMNRL